MLPFYTPGNDVMQIVSTDREPTVMWEDVCRCFCTASQPGGRVFSGGANNGNISVWDQSTGIKEDALMGHEDCVVGLFYYEGKLYSSSADSTVRSWSLSKKRAEMVFKGHRALVAALCATHSNNHTGLYSGSDDETIKQWNTETGICVHTFKGHEAAINTIVCSETHMYSAADDGRVFMWELFTRLQVRSFTAHVGSVWCQWLLPDGRLITCGNDGLIKVWNQPIVNDEVKLTLEGHTGRVRRLLVQGPILFSGGADAIVNVWNLNSGRQLEQLHAHDKQITSLTMQNNKLVSTGFDMQFCRWDMEDILPVKQPIVPHRPLGETNNPDEEAAADAAGRTHASFESDPRVRAKLMKDEDMTFILEQYTAIPTRFVLNSLKMKVDTSRLMSELWLFVPFLLSFIFFFLLRRPIEDTYYMSSGINDILVRTDLPDLKVAKTYKDFGQHSDVERWLDGVVVPTLFEGRQTTGAAPNVLRGQNILIGALRLRMQRVTDDSCHAGDFSPNDLCYGVASSGNLNKSKTYFHSFWNYSSTGGKVFSGFAAKYPTGGYILDVPYTLSLADARARVRAAIAHGMLDRVATRFLSTEVVMYNPYLDSFMTSVYSVEFTQEGSLICHVHNFAFNIFDANVGMTIYEGYFMAFVLFYVGLITVDLVQSVRKRRALAFIISIWNMLEFANLLIFVVMYIYRIRWHINCSTTDFRIPFTADRYPTELQDIQDDYIMQVWLNSVNTILTFMKLLKFVRLNNRLNILTRTLSAAQQSLVGVLVLFVYVVFAFAICGNALYGSNLWGFRTIGVAYSTLMRQLLGDFDYQALRYEQEHVTVVFFWGFEVLALFIMLNFLVAVITDGFADVSLTKSHIPLDAAIVKAFREVTFEMMPMSLRRKFVLFRNRTTQTSVIERLMHRIYRDCYDDHMTRTRARSGSIGGGSRSGSFITSASFELESDGGDEGSTVEFTGADSELQKVPDDDVMKRANFVLFVPRDERRLATRKFIVEVWRNIAWEYHHYLIDQTHLEEHEKAEVMHEAVRRAMVPLLQTMPLFDAYLSRIEKMNVKLCPNAERDNNNASNPFNNTASSSTFSPEVAATNAFDRTKNTPFLNPWAVDTEENNNDNNNNNNSTDNNNNPTTTTTDQN
eukprot:PhM_4_TR6742/c0_g1_i1/m.71748